MEIELLNVSGFREAVVAMRLPYESGEKSDSRYCFAKDVADPRPCEDCRKDLESWCLSQEGCGNRQFVYGEKDLELMKKLIKGGSEHRSFMRFIRVDVLITAPRYWWQEMDRYRIGKEQISSSTMHLLTKRDLTQDDFEVDIYPETLKFINYVRNDKSLSEKDKLRTMKINLPESFLQRRAVMFSYETLLTIYRQRKDHRLYEWKEIFCPFVKSLPYMKEFLKSAGL